MKAALLNRILVVLAFLGLFISGILTLEAGWNLEVPCGPSGGCAAVAASSASRMFGIPVAYFGLAAYLVLAALAVYRTTLPVVKWSRLVTFGYLFAAVGSAESLWLQYQSLFVIRAECVWCISSAVTLIASFVVYALLAQEVDSVITKTPVSEESATPDAVIAPRPRPEFGLPAILAVVVIAGVSILGATMHKGRYGAKPAPANTNAKDLVPPGAHILGDPSSPLTVVEFADLLCPTCQRISPELQKYVLGHKGKVRLVFRNFPLASLHPLAMTAATIDEIAADQGRYWEYMEAVMALHRQPNDANELMDIAKATGLNLDLIRKRVDNTSDPAYARLQRDLDTVHALGIGQTPTFYTVYDGKAQETISSSEIFDSLNSSKYQKVMNGPPVTVPPASVEGIEAPNSHKQAPGLNVGGG